MATSPKFATINHPDPSINRVQDHLAKTLDPLVASPLNGAVLLKNIALKTGVNIVPHSLNNRPKGFEVARIHSTITPVDWTNPTFSNGWSISTFGGGWPATSYRVTAAGKVELRGLLINAGVPAGSSLLATYPAPLAPTSSTTAAGRLFGVPGLWNTNGGFVFRCDVYATATGGAQFIWQAGPAFYNAGTGASVSYMTLDGISWDIATPPTPTLADNLDVQPEDATKVIRITSSGPCTADLLFF